MKAAPFMARMYALYDKFDDTLASPPRVSLSLSLSLISRVKPAEKLPLISRDFITLP
jgi:hypothetical protein